VVARRPQGVCATTTGLGQSKGSASDLLPKACGTFFVGQSRAFGLAQIRVFSFVGKRTRSIRNPQRCSCSSPLAPAYSMALDHCHSSALFTKPRRTGFQWMYSTVS